MERRISIAKPAMKSDTLCKSEGCWNFTNMRSDRPSANLWCSACLQRRWRKNNPIKAHLHWLKDSARKRHLAFSLTFEQFELFVIQTQLITRNLTVDRIDNLKGYHADNIQALTRSENCIKKNRFDKLRK